MKKLVRILGLSVVIGLSFVSCTKDEIKDGDLEGTQKNLEGTYKIKSISVPVAVDLDNDGVKNTNLLLENGKICVWDNIWKFGGPSMFIKDSGIKCDVSSPDILLDESFEFNSSTRIISFLSGDTSSYTDVEIIIVSGKKEINFKTVDKTLNQIRSYTLIQI